MKTEILYKVLSILTVCLAIGLLLACNPSVPPEDLLVIDNDPPSSDCCSETFTSNISGISPLGGQHYYLALMKDGMIVKNGPSVFIPEGPFSAVPLNVSVAYHDNIKTGDYQLEANACSDISAVGVRALRTIAASASSVSVPSYTFMDCKNCYAVEIRYRAFIQCAYEGLFAILPIPVACPYMVIPVILADNGKGDNRDFQYLGGSSRSHQRVTLFWDPITDQWTYETNQFFGQTTTYKFGAMTSDGSPTCPWSLVQPDSVKCTGTAAIGDQYGSQQSIAVVDRRPQGGDLEVSIDLRGYPPCTDPLLFPDLGIDFTPCAIDGHIIASLRINQDQYGNPVPQIKWNIQHDGFPAHELYVNGDFQYFWDPQISGDDLFSLCGAFFICEDNGENFANMDWTNVLFNQ